MRLVVTQIVRRLTEEMGGRADVPRQKRHRLLFLLDEFAALKKIPAIEESMAVAAGYGLKFFLILQAQEQLKAVYGERESLSGNCHVRIAYAPNTLPTGEMISKMLGKETIETTSTTRNQGQKSFSTQGIGRDLMTPDEVMALPGPIKGDDGRILKPGKVLIFVAGRKPILGDQFLYFQNPEMLAKTQMKPIVTNKVLAVEQTKPTPVEQTKPPAANQNKKKEGA